MIGPENMPLKANARDEQGPEGAGSLALQFVGVHLQDKLHNELQTFQATQSV